MSTVPADAREALDMVRAGLGYLAAVDAAQLPVAIQAEVLRELAWRRSPPGRGTPMTRTAARCPG